MKTSRMFVSSSNEDHQSMRITLLFRICLWTGKRMGGMKKYGVKGTFVSDIAALATEMCSRWHQDAI